MGSQSRTRLSDFTSAHHSFFWKYFPVFLFPEPRSCAQNALCHAGPPIFPEELATATAAAHSLGQRCVRCDSAPAGEIQQGAEVGAASAKGADPAPRASPSVSAELGSPSCAVWCETCVGNLCFTLAPSSAPEWDACAGTQASPLPRPPQAAAAASFRVQVQHCCNFSGKLKKKKKKKS